MGIKNPLSNGSEGKSNALKSKYSLIQDIYEFENLGWGGLRNSKPFNRLSVSSILLLYQWLNWPSNTISPNLTKRLQETLRMGRESRNRTRVLNYRASQQSGSNQVSHLGLFISGDKLTIWNLKNDCFMMSAWRILGNMPTACLVRNIWIKPICSKILDNGAQMFQKCLRCLGLAVTGYLWLILNPRWTVELMIFRQFSIRK